MTLWSAAAAQGWFELGDDGALDYAVAATRRLGRAACPLPLLDGYAAAELFPDTGVASGDVRVVLCRDATSPVDAADAATHVLVIPKLAAAPSCRTIDDVRSAAGPGGTGMEPYHLRDHVAVADIDAGQAERALVLTRLGKAARALAAAEYAHELAIEHATTRTQFGKVIGSFGAVQQRTAQCQIEIRSANLLLDDAVAALMARAARGRARRRDRGCARRCHSPEGATRCAAHLGGHGLLRRASCAVAVPASPRRHRHAGDPQRWHGPVGDVLVETGGAATRRGPRRQGGVVPATSSCKFIADHKAKDRRAHTDDDRRGHRVGDGRKRLVRLRLAAGARRSRSATRPKKSCSTKKPPTTGSARPSRWRR